MNSELENSVRAKYHRTLISLPLVSLGVAMAALGLMKSEAAPSFLPVILLMVILSLAVWLMIGEMVRSGKIYAKGAKKRRKQILPFIYARKAH